MPTVCLASLEPRKLKLNLGSPYPKGDAAPSHCRIGDTTPHAQERCNSLPEKRSSNLSRLWRCNSTYGTYRYQ